MRVVALVNTPCAPDARVMREAQALAEAGHDVLVICQWSLDLPEEETVAGVRYLRVPVGLVSRRNKRLADRKKNANVSRPIGGVRKALHDVAAVFGLGVGVDQVDPKQSAGHSLIQFIIRIVPTRVLTGLRTIASRSAVMFIQRLYKYDSAFRMPASEFRPDVVHAHDIYTLLAGKRIKAQTGAKLIYDSHELEVGRNGNFSWYSRFTRENVEGYLIKSADAVITVSDSIAEFLAELYEIKCPIVIHNTRIMPELREDAADVRSQIGLDPQTPLALYVGGITITRGVENCVRALAHAPTLHLACIGTRYAPVEKTILADAERLGIRDRLHLIDPVPHDEVTSFVRTGDISLIAIQDVCLSYRFCFPNKLLESLLSSLPVVVSGLVELERMIDRTHAGVVVDETDPADIARGIMEVIDNRERYRMSPEAIAKLKDEYGWPAQTAKLLSLYESLHDESQDHAMPLSPVSLS